MQASSPTNVCRFAANIYISRRGRVPPPYRASCPSPTKQNIPVLIPAVTQPKQRRGYFLMPEGKQQRQQGQQAKQVDATNQQGSFQRTQDRPQALLTGQLGVFLPRDGQQPVGAAVRGVWPCLRRRGSQILSCSMPLISATVRPSSSKGSLCFIFSYRWHTT